MALPDRKADLIHLLNEERLKFTVRIDGLIQSVDESSRLSGMQKSVFKDKIEPQLIEIRDLIGELKSPNIDRLVEADLNNLVECLNPDILGMGVFEAIDDFINLKDKDVVKLAETIQRISRTFFYDTQPENGVSNSSFIDIINKINLLNSVSVRKAAEEIAQSDAMFMEAQRSLDDANKTAKELLDKAEAIQKGEAAKDEIKKFKDEAKTNLYSLLLCAAILGLAIYLEYAFMFEYLINIPLKITQTIPDSQFYLLIMKNIFNSVLFFTIFYALLKASSAFLHNYLVNREKASSLYAFDKFFTIHDEPIVKLNATMEVVKTVLGVRDTGIYKQQEVGSSNQPDILQRASQIRDFFPKKE